MSNRLTIPPEIGLKYPLNVNVMIDSREFIENEPKKFNVENCTYKWEAFRENYEELHKNSRNHAYLLFPGKYDSLNCLNFVCYFQSMPISVSFLQNF